MVSTLIVFLLLVGIVVSISYLTYYLVNRELRKRRLAVEEKLNNLVDKEKTLKEIEERIADTNRKMRKIAPISIILSFLLILLGLYGIGNFLRSYFIESSRLISEINIIRNLILCPLIILYGISILIKNIKVLRNIR